MRAGRGREPQKDMSAAEVVAIVDRLEAASLAVWLDGGWGVDALAGTQTRAHDDLDLVVLLKGVPAVERELAELGYERAGGGPPMSFESVDRDGCQVDVHPVALDEHGDGVYVNRDGTTWPYPARGFAGRGVVAGRSVRCLTAEVQVICHAGYELDEGDLHDVRLLQPQPDVLEAFGVRGAPQPLRGGTGRAWRAGDLVVKRSIARRRRSPGRRSSSGRCESPASGLRRRYRGSSMAGPRGVGSRARTSAGGGSRSSRWGAASTLRSRTCRGPMRSSIDA